MEYKTEAVSAHLWPHDHRSKTGGPWTLHIGVKYQPDTVKKWESRRVYFSMDQPEQDTNFTMMWVMYLRGGRAKPDLVRGLTFHNARQYSRKTGAREIRIRGRYGNSFPHPVPLGVYTGTCMYDPDGGMAVYTFQAVTLKKEPEKSEPKLILTPGDEEFHGTLAEASRTLGRKDGLGRGGTETGGVHVV